MTDVRERPVAPPQASREGTDPAGVPRDPLFLPPFDALDDAALLAHYRVPRAARYEPVADPDETRPDRIEAVLTGDFRFNGEAHRLPDPVQWLVNPSADVEWHILLHKFYYAVGLGLSFRRSGDRRYVERWAELLDGWMRSVPVGFIAADVTGRRVQNWIYSLPLFLGDHRAPIEPAFFRRLLRSIYAQVEFLCANLTPKRNHRTLELLAIFLAGIAFPEMRRASHWRAFALEQSAANAHADLLRDGVHCELSTDYHHLALRNWLHVRRLAATNGLAVPDALDRAIEAALQFSLHVHRPDGIVPSLSDGDARSFVELLAEGARLYGREDLRYVATGGREGRAPALRVATFAASGYSVVRSGWGDASTPYRDEQHLVFDCGPLGEGNHGHFDALSFELAAHGRSLVVDPGRYTYSEADCGDGINWRVHFRSTAAHNTVCIDGRSQTRYEPKAIPAASRHAAGSVRHKIAGPAPATRLLERCVGHHLDLLRGETASTEYDAVHERTLVFVDRHYWIVTDRLRARTLHRYDRRFQLSDEAQGRTRLATRDGAVCLHAPGLTIACPEEEGSTHEIVGGWVSTRYGHRQPAPALRSSRRASDASFDALLLPWKVAEPAVALQSFDVECEDRDGDVRGLAIRLDALGRGVTDRWLQMPRRVARASFAGFEFAGRWLHLRTDAEGRTIRALSHAGAVLRHHGEPVTIETGDEVLP